MKTKIESISIIIFFLILIYFPIFLHLDHIGLYLWDEAINALQAYEMSQNGNYLRRHFLGQVDNWETKPPMLIWLQVIFMKIVGYNELAVRLPSAFAALFTVILILRFFIKELNFLIGGIFSGLVLLCSSGYVKGHVSRSGDHDALLIFFLIAGLLYFYKYLKKGENHKFYLAVFTFFFISGVLTKSIAGLYFAPALLIFTLIEKQFLSTIKSKSFWLSVLVFFLVIGTYYGLNEYHYPGYLKTVWGNELFPRFFNSSADHDYQQLPDSLHYVKSILKDKFKFFFIFIPLSLLLVFFQKDQKLRRFTSLILICTILFLFVISNGTYNSWYDAPVFPLLAILVGSGLGIVYNALKVHLKISKLFLGILFYVIFLFTFFFTPYKEIIIEQCYFPKLHKHDPHYGDFFKRLKKHNPELKNIFVYYEPRNRHFLFYRNIFNDQYDYNIRSCGSGTNSIRNCKPHQQAKPGEHIMVCNQNLKKEVLEIFKVKEVNSYKDCKLYLVLSK